MAAERRRIDNGFASSISLSPFRTIGQGRWTSTATNGSNLKQGQPTTIRYSIVPDNTPIRGFNGEPAAPSNLQARLTQIYGSKAAWLNLFARVGAALSAQSGLTYVYEPNDDGAAFGPTSTGDQSPGQIGVRGDVRVSGHEIDGDGGTLAYNYSPNSGEMVIDTADKFYENRQGDDLGFRNTITHEFGHGVGLGHTCPINETKLMEPYVSLSFDGPQFDDIRGLQRFYGDPIEDNDTAETGTNLGALSNGNVTAVPGKILSIDDAADVDFFQFSTLANKSIGITLAPTGNAYLEAAQSKDTDEFCEVTPGTLLDPKAINDLGFELFQANTAGDFVSVATVNATGVGGTETLDPTNFVTGGNFRIRVFGGAATNVQTYSLQLVVGSPVTQPTPGPTPTVAPTPTPGPTALPQPTPIRPIVDLNNLNSDEAQGQDSPTPSGIDNTAFYDFKTPGILPDGKPGLVNGGPQFITPNETIVVSDISARPVIPGKAIVEARVELTPDDSCYIDPNRPVVPDGIAPDNCNFVNKRDNEVLGVNADALKAVNDGLQQNISASYDVNSQILTLRGGVRGLDEIRNAYQQALKTVTYENKLPITAPNQPFNRQPNLRDRIITYVVDTDNDDTNNQDGRFGFVDGPNSNPKQSKPATLTLKFRERQSLVVTTNSDFSAPNDNETSLREAIEYANTIPFSNPDPDPKKPPIPTPPSVITFASGVGGTINLTAPLPVINNNQKSLTIQGPGARQLTVDASSAGSRVFQINSNTAISGLTISGGTANADTTGGAAYGGGIFIGSGSTLSVDACTISGNSARFGGGIANRGGILTLTNSTISGNDASSNGGGLYLSNSSSSSISNSTISGNSGSGIAQVSGVSQTTLSTITDNAPSGVESSNGTARFGNSIIAGNAADHDVMGTESTYFSDGYNIIGSGNAVRAFSPATNDNRSNIGDSAGLSALINNGGPTDTHALLAGSPAIDAGDPGFAPPPATDQRGEGFDRVINGRVDAGALEKQNNNPIVNPVISPRNPTTNETITVTANSDATNLTYTFFVNGNQRQTGTQATFDLSRPGFGSRGDTITVIVTATNASGTTTGQDSVVVADTPPSFSVTITATNPVPNTRTDEPLTNSTLTAATTGTDPDGGQINYSYQWSVNGEILPQERGKTIDLSKPGNGDRDDIVSVEVTVQGAGTKTASVTVGNTAPIPQLVKFNVTAGQTVRVLLQASDVDTKQPTQANPDGVDTRFRFTLRTQATKGTAYIQTNSDGRDVLVYTANADAVRFDTLEFTATDTARYDGRRLRLGPGYKTSYRTIARAIIAPKPSAPAKSGASAAKNPNPSGGSS